MIAAREARGLLLLLLTVLLPPTARADGPKARLSFAAAFQLEIGGRAGVERSSGTVAFLPDGTVCVRVATPLRQELRFGPRESVVYYPERDLALRGRAEPDTAPPMLDAVLAGAVDPASTLPKGSKLLEQKREGEALVTRWRLSDSEGHDLGRMRTVETRDGVVELELSDADGGTQRRFEFADRVRQGAGTLARGVHARYFNEDGALVREERWRLTGVRPVEPGDRGCAQPGPKTRIEEIEL